MLELRLDSNLAGAVSKNIPFKSRLRPWPAQQGKPRRQPPAWWPLMALIVAAGILYGAAVLRQDDYDTSSRGPAGSGNGTFSLCRRAAQQNCVVDGDTIHFGGEVIRIADINTPEVHEAKCDAE